MSEHEAWLTRRHLALRAVDRGDRPLVASLRHVCAAGWMFPRMGFLPCGPSGAPQGVAKGRAKVQGVFALEEARVSLPRMTLRTLDCGNHLPVANARATTTEVTH